MLGSLFQAGEPNRCLTRRIRERETYAETRGGQAGVGRTRSLRRCHQPAPGTVQRPLGLGEGMGGAAGDPGKVDAVTRWMVSCEMTSRPQLSGPVAVPLFGNRVFANDHGSMRSSRWILVPQDHVLMKWGNVDMEDRHTGRMHGKLQAEAGGGVAPAGAGQRQATGAPSREGVPPAAAEIRPPACRPVRQPAALVHATSCGTRFPCPGELTGWAQRLSMLRVWPKHSEKEPEEHRQKGLADAVAGPGGTAEGG